eukprot:jgi/Botrbrau1/21159/Bobra.0061s0052.1
MAIVFPIWSRSLQSIAHVRKSSHSQDFRALSLLTLSRKGASKGPPEYEELCEKLKEISNLDGISGLLDWDEMVMMPQGASAARAAQKATLAGIAFEKKTEPRIGELLKQLDGADLSDPYQAAVVREACRDYDKLTRVPKELVKRRAELESEGYQAWVEARSSKDFSKFQPYLEEWVDLTKKIYTAIDPTRPIYDVALDQFEKGITSERLDQVFTQVRGGLVPLLKEIREKGTPPDSSALNGTFDKAQQALLADQVAKDLGFDLDKGRLDVSVHPFTGGAGPRDVRMTTRFKDTDLTEGLTGAIHEDRPRSAHGMGVHESQSLLWERMVGLGRSFAKYLAPKLASQFPQLPQDLSADQVYAAVNVVKEPSMIRVEADEVTYPLHIILRYELEKALLEGKVQVKELPALWNERMTSDLGCTPEDDARGVLQDVHWAGGAFGYFPTYSLGAMYACQIYQAAEKQLPGLAEDIEKGNFAPLKKWLNEKVHTVGSLYPSADDLLVAVTGQPLDPAIFLDYLTTKYRELYKL